MNLQCLCCIMLLFYNNIYCQTIVIFSMNSEILIIDYLFFLFYLFFFFTFSLFSFFPPFSFLLFFFIFQLAAYRDMLMDAEILGELSRVFFARNKWWGNLLRDIWVESNGNQKLVKIDPNSHQLINMRSSTAAQKRRRRKRKEKRIEKTQWIKEHRRTSEAG